jgi:hypothetical protein
MAELIKTRRAWFFDKKGEYHGKKGFKKHDRTFKYGKGSFNVDFQESSYKEDVPVPFLWRRRTYFYNTENSNPIKLDKKAEPRLSPELYNINLETKVARDLNDLAKKGILSFLNPKIIIILLVGGAIAYYLFSGGKLW